MNRIKKYILWVKTIHYPNKLRSHLFTIAPMAPFTPKSTSKLGSVTYNNYTAHTESLLIKRVKFIES